MIRSGFFTSTKTVLDLDAPGRKTLRYFKLQEYYHRISFILHTLRQSGK